MPRLVKVEELVNDGKQFLDCQKKVNEYRGKTLPVDVGLTVFVVPVVEEDHEWNEEEVDAKDDLFEIEGGKLAGRLRLVSATGEQVEGH